MSIYLDHSATTPPAPEVVQAVQSLLTQNWGKTSDNHGPGPSQKRHPKACGMTQAQASQKRLKRSDNGEPHSPKKGTQKFAEWPMEGWTDAHLHFLRCFTGTVRQKTRLFDILAIFDNDPK